MRRLADLKIEKEYGFIGDGELLELAAPQAVDVARCERRRGDEAGGAVSASSRSAPSRSSNNARTSSNASRLPRTCCRAQLPEGMQDDLARAGPLEAIQLYDQLLAKYPSHEHNDQVLYQKARAYDELGRTEEAMKVMEQLIAAYPNSRYLDEVQFRRAEYFFTRKKFRDAEGAYAAIIAMGPASEYYELALYKLGWTLYKQDFYDEALHQYVALLDYKVSIGYDFDAQHDEGDERRIADTFDVISLSFSNLGGPEVVQQYFARQRQAQLRGPRLQQSRRVLPDEAALPRRRQVLQRVHRAVPAAPALAALQHARDRDLRDRRLPEAGARFEEGVRQQLRPECGVLAPLRRAAVARSAELPEEQPEGSREPLSRAVPGQAARRSEKLANYAEAAHWYREYLASFRNDAETPAINYQLADLLLEKQDFAARRASTSAPPTTTRRTIERLRAGYAAIYAHREHLKVVDEQSKLTARRDTVASSLRFADTFPEHEHAPTVLGAAADDLYEMKDFAPALSAGAS